MEVDLPKEVFDRLIPHAERRSIAPAQLVRVLIETILKDDLVNAILDDEGEDA